MKRLALAFCLLGAALGLGACGIPTDQSATKLPNQLQTPVTPPTTVPSGPATRQLDVYFLKDGRLFPVHEYYSTDAAVAALLALSIGPTLYQSREGITTGFAESPAKISLAGAPTRDGVASVEVDSSFYDQQGSEVEEASAQIVYTLTGIPDGPAAVQFLFGQDVLDSFIPPGRLVDRPVTRADYCQLAPVGTPCGTTIPPVTASGPSAASGLSGPSAASGPSAPSGPSGG